MAVEQVAAEVAAFISEKYCEAKVLYRHNPLVSLDTGKTSEDGLPAMMQKLSDTIPSLTGTTIISYYIIKFILSSTRNAAQKYSQKSYLQNFYDYFSKV